MRVKALTRGYYADRIVEPDQQFNLKKAEHFSSVWMEKISGFDDVAATEKPKRAPKKKSEPSSDDPDFA